MILNRHLYLAGKHAQLSPSNPHWINYDEDKAARVFTAAMAARRGDELHAFAATAIKLGEKLPQKRKTLNMFVNDAIRFRMTPEQPLVYNDDCYGHADAVSFRKHMLRVHDLKTGVVPAHIAQLQIYAALFCLEYEFVPFDIAMELRIYQNDMVEVHEADPDVIFRMMEKIKFLSKLYNQLKMEAEL